MKVELFAAEPFLAHRASFTTDERGRWSVSAFAASGDKSVMNLVFVRALSAANTVASVTIASALPMISFPSNATTNRVSLGSIVTLAAEATSAVSSVSFQWRFGATNLPGASNATLVINRVRTNDAGVYVLRASDADGDSDSPSRTVLLGPTFTKLTNETVGTSGSVGIAWGDLNQDGWIDLFYTERSSALTTLFTNNGHGGFARTGGSIGANMVNPLGATWGDFDNNSALDLFIANNNGGNDSLYRNDGRGRSHRSRAAASSGARAMGTAACGATTTTTGCLICSSQMAARTIFFITTMATELLRA